MTVSKSAIPESWSLPSFSHHTTIVAFARLGTALVRRAQHDAGTWERYHAWLEHADGTTCMPIASAPFVTQNGQSGELDFVARPRRGEFAFQVTHPDFEALWILGALGLDLSQADFGIYVVEMSGSADSATQFAFHMAKRLATAPDSVASLTEGHWPHAAAPEA